MTNFSYQNILEIFHQDIKRYSPLIEFIQTIMQGESSLTTGERELIAAYVSGLNACKYCQGLHQAIAVELNVEPIWLEAVLSDLSTAPVEERLLPVLALVRKLTLNPSQTTPADLDAILQAGWDEKAIEDVINVCALFNFMNRFVDAYGLQTPSSEQLAAMATEINATGYKAVLQSS